EPRLENPKSKIENKKGLSRKERGLVSALWPPVHSYLAVRSSRSLPGFSTCPAGVRGGCCGIVGPVPPPLLIRSLFDCRSQFNTQAAPRQPAHEKPVPAFDRIIRPNDSMESWIDSG